MSLLSRVATTMAKTRLAASGGVRLLATETTPKEMPNPEDIMQVEDPVEGVWGRERRILLARLAGDDRYEEKIYRKGPGTKDNPNLVPSYYENRLIACHCEPHMNYKNFWWLRKGMPRRCQCGHWFKAVDAERLSFW